MLDFFKHSLFLFLAILFVYIFIDFWNSLDEKSSGGSGRDKDTPHTAQLKTYCMGMLKTAGYTFAGLIALGTLLGLIGRFIPYINTAIKAGGSLPVPGLNLTIATPFMHRFIELSFIWTALLVLGCLAFILAGKKHTFNFATRKSLFFRKKRVTDKDIVGHPVKKKNNMIYEPLKEGCPTLSLLDWKDGQNEKSHLQAEEMKGKLLRCLNEFDIDFLKVTKVEVGPTITRFVLQMTKATGRISKITAIEREICMFLKVDSVTITPSSDGLVMELPNTKRNTVPFSEVIKMFKERQTSDNPLEVPLGKTAVGELQMIKINSMPHLLVAGTTGSGKSVCINAMIASILLNATPEEVKLLFIDPKVVEFTMYNGIPHLLSPVITDPVKATMTLDWAVKEMEDRYQKMAGAGVRNIESYNAKMKRNCMPYIVIIIDELAQLMMVSKSKKNEDLSSVEDSIQKLGQMARAAGIHLIVGTQRPSSDVITGTIKTNIPSRIAFAVSDGVNSRIILDSSGAEKLLGRGDGLLLTTEHRSPVRFQSSFISDKELERIIDFWKEQNMYSSEEKSTFAVDPVEYIETPQADVPDIPDTQGRIDFINSNCIDNSCSNNPEKPEQVPSDSDKLSNEQVTVDSDKLSKLLTKMVNPVNPDPKLSEKNTSYRMIKTLVAQIALDDEEEVYLPPTNTISETLDISKPYLLEQINTLISEEWLEKLGDSPRTTKYKVVVSQELAANWLVSNEKQATFSM